MENGYINIRSRVMSFEDIGNSITHNYRIRKNLNNVDYSKTDNNGLLFDKDEAYENKNIEYEKHKSLYKKVYGRKPQKGRVNPFREILITFPSKFRKLYDEGVYTMGDFINNAEKFIRAWEADTGLKMIDFAFHQDEDTPHIHITTTNTLPNGKMFRPGKGQKSSWQDMGGEAFKSMGLSRGIPKHISGASHSSKSQWVSKVSKDMNRLESIDLEALTPEEIEEHIQTSEKPIKTFWTYFKRANNKEREAEYIIQQQERAVAKFNQVFTKTPVENFEDLVDFLIARKGKNGEIEKGINKYK